MFTHPDVLAELVRQRQRDLLDEAASRSRQVRARRAPRRTRRDA